MILSLRGDLLRNEEVLSTEFNFNMGKWTQSFKKACLSEKFPILLQKYNMTRFDNMGKCANRFKKDLFDTETPHFSVFYANTFPQNGEIP